MKPILRTLALSCALALALPWCAAQDAGQINAPQRATTSAPPASAPVATLAPVVVTSTRISASAFDIGASIDRIGSDAVRESHALVNISESLGGVPGLLARDRQNYAQDVQISVRGFGARSTFGIRGVRLYVDGIPATLPDGQGQITNVELGSVDRIEVLRGPFSAIYGNSSGGVIQVVTEEGQGAPAVTLTAGAGSDSLLRVGLRASGSSGALSYSLSGSRFTTDGYRDHSEVERQLGNAKLVLRPDDASSLTLVANSVALPKAQDPLGLTRAQFEANPRGVDPSALAFDTRKTVEQTQLGLIYERRLDGGNTLRVLVYDGHRGTDQFQSIPVATQANPLHPGGEIVLARNYRGADARWTWKGDIFGDRPLTIVGGLSYDTLDEHRQGYQNFVGTTLGVRGALRRDENNTVSNVDPYLQASWNFASRWTLDLGVRRSRVRFKSEDAYVVGTNPDDSGAASYSATLPVASLVYAPNDGLRLYASAGRGFETPTLNELAYRPGGGTGLNFALQSSTSRNVEFGVKLRDASFGQMTAALFETDTDREIVTLTNAGGRATYQNAGATRRRGLELGWTQSWFESLRANVALSWLDAVYRDAYTTCTGAPCAPLVVPGGNRIPGIARTSLYAALGWAPPEGWRAGVELRALGRVMVNDANGDAAPGYGVFSANAGYLWKPSAAWEVGAFARVDNALARRYAGSVIVNEGNARYFEPAPGRTWLLGTSATLRF